jgi:hypothetical protein
MFTLRNNIIQLVSKSERRCHVYRRTLLQPKRRWTVTGTGATLWLALTRH